MGGPLNLDCRVAEEQRFFTSIAESRNKKLVYFSESAFLFLEHKEV